MVVGRSLPIVSQPQSYRELRQVSLGTKMISSIKLGSSRDSGAGLLDGLVEQMT